MKYSNHPELILEIGLLGLADEEPSSDLDNKNEYQIQIEELKAEIKTLKN